MEPGEVGEIRHLGWETRSIQGSQLGSGIQESLAASSWKMQHQSVGLCGRCPDGKLS